MKLSGHPLFLPLGIALACLGSSSLRADVRYTLVAPMAMKGVTGSAEITTYSKPGKRREEMTMNMTTSSLGNMSTKSITITRCDQQKIYDLDESLKIYTTRPLINTKTNLGMSTQGESKGGEGKLDMTITVQNLGTENIGTFNTQHVMITMRMQNSGCLGTRDSTTKMEFWTAPIKVDFCQEMWVATHTMTNPNGCKITVDNHGDLAAMKEFSGRMPVRQKVYQGDRVLMSYDLKDHSEAALDDALFAIPAGYKEVSATEFAQAQQKAAAGQFRGGAGGRAK